MKGDPRIIEILNEVLTAELTAINEYFIHSKMCKNWGYPRLAERARSESIEEMKHADRIIERILFLEGVPNMQRLYPVKVGESVPEQFGIDLALELDARERLKRGIAITLDCGDHVTRELLETILADEEEGIDWLETQIALIAEVGKERYLAEHIHG